ncbi:hypothetical protein [Microbacterium sp. XT11]|uniref:hypothetical protein n=1 Tax=Microbacterium sp. XT11 TaxID=367477 RepID=UPI0012FB858C|nr:hypothetical protein [Microbacterium sp. XT11]
MTRTSGGRAAAAATIVGLALLPLSGCLYAQIPEHPTAVESTPASDGPADEPADEPSDPPADAPADGLSFADGASIPASAHIEWGDGFFMDDGWTVTSPDDGNGGWAYGTTDGTCVARFWQGDVSGLPLVAGDDSASSDALLAYVIGDASAADITPLAVTASLGYGTGSNQTLEARQIIGEDGDRRWAITARAFTANAHGVYVIADCTGGDLEAVFAEIVEKNPVVVSG